MDHHKALESLFNLVFLTSWNGSQKSWHWNKYSQILWVCRGGGGGGGDGEGDGGRGEYRIFPIRIHFQCAEADWAKLEFVCRTGWRLYKNLFILVGENALAVKGAWNRGYSLALVILIIQVGPNWRAPSKRGVCTYFIAIFHAYSFCVKKCPCFFFQESRKIWTKLHENPPPLSPLSPCVRNQTL